MTPVPTREYVPIESVELVARRGRVQGDVRTPRFPALLPSPLPSTPAALHAENLALRHQLFVLQRVHQNRRLRLRSCDRLVWVWLSRVWPHWRSALCIVKPETVIAWHRQGFRLYWKWKSRASHGRPSVPPEVQNLIQKISSANPRWGRTSPSW
jgi:hypothetical protein